MVQPHTSSTGACLHLFCGKAGAGKSTLAAAIAAAEQAFLISEDVWLARLYGDEMRTFEDYKRLSARLRSIVEPLTIDLLRAGRHVVLDLPANTISARARLRSLIDTAGSAHVLHYVDSPEATCLERIGKRNAERPEGSHHLTPAQFASISSFFESPTDEEGFTVRRHALR
jgi:predicted kinase